MLTQEDKQWIAIALGEALGMLAERLYPIMPPVRGGGRRREEDCYRQYRETKNSVIEVVLGAEELERLLMEALPK